MKPEPAFPSARAPAASPGGNGECDGERPPAALLKELPGAVYRCRNDADWTVEFISDGCLALTGYRADELTGSRVTSLGALMHPGDAAAVWEKCQASLAARQPCSNEYRILHRTGETRWVWDQAHGVYSPGGGLLHIEGLLMDITPRKRAEAALRIREEWLRLSLRAANIGLWDWDVITNQVAYSPEWKSQLGYAAEEIGSAFAEWESRVHPDDLAPTLERVRRALAAGETAYEVEFRMRHKDGAWRWIYTRAEIFRDDRGQAVRVIGCHVDITERKRAEQRLAAFAALGRRLNTAPDDTAAARIIADTADELFGWDSCKVDFYDAQTDRSRSILTVDVVNGRRQEFSPALSDTEPSPRLRQVVTTGALLILRPEPVTLSPDSTPFGDKSRPSASIMAVPIREAGKVVGVLAIQSYRLNAYTEADLAALQDLADHCAGALERIRSRTDLERQRNELALILDTVPGIIFYKDRNHRLVRVNEAHARSLGLPRSAVEGRTDSELGSPYEERYVRDDEEVMRTGQPKLGIIEPQHTPAGGTRWLQTDKLPYRDADGNIIGILGFALDITERKLAEAALRESEENFQNLFEASPDAIIVATRSGGIQTINRMAEQLFGYPRAELVGQAIELLMPARFRHGHVAHRENYIRDPRLRPMGEGRDLLARRKDGTEFPADIALSPIATEEGVLVICTIRDITKRKQAEAELVELSGRLLRAQDEERRRLARELHDSTAQTFAALAMNLAVLGRGTPGLDDAGRALLAECETQVRRGTAELRTLAYLLHPPALEALGLARAIHDYAEGFARRSGVRVELDVAEPPDRLPPETELALFRVLQESLGNLHRHSGSATAAIRLAQDAETVVIEVRDTGRGLAAAALAAANSGSARFGVGIAGMRERLRLLGGRLEIEAALPGVRVRATLPLPATADE